MSLSSTSTNRLFYLGLIITSAALLKWGYSQLVIYESEARKSEEIKSHYISQENEDALKAKTLDKLLSSPNWIIAETTTQIIFDRSLHDASVFTSVLDDIARPDREIRTRAVNALHMLTGPFVAMRHIGANYKPATIAKALVTALSHCQTDVEHDVYDPDFDSFGHRDVCERHCLSLLCRFSDEYDHSMSDFVQAGLVPLWLAKEPFGTTAEEVQRNFAHLFHGGNDPERAMLSSIVFKIGQDALGRRQLHEAGLVSTPTTLFDDVLPTRGHHWHDDGDSDAAAIGLQLDRRESERSPEEIRLRLRNRNTMVLNDGIHPISTDDIFQRELMSPSLLASVERVEEVE